MCHVSCVSLCALQEVQDTSDQQSLNAFWTSTANPTPAPSPSLAKSGPVCVAVVGCTGLMAYGALNLGYLGHWPWLGQAWLRLVLVFLPWLGPGPSPCWNRIINPSIL